MAKQILLTMILLHCCIPNAKTEGRVKTTLKKEISTDTLRLPVDYNNPGKGVAIMSDQTPTHTNDIINPEQVRQINFTGNSVYIQQRPLKSREQATGFDLTFNSTIGIENCTSLPDIQTTYSQGRSYDGKLQWFGPETGEIFSWGPALRLLEFDGSPYDYDKNGHLVPAGTGSGIPANSYGTGNFFRTGFSTGNNIRFLLPLYGNSTYIEGNIGQNLRNSPIRNSDFESYNTSLSLKRIRFHRFEAEASASYNISEGKLLNGSNLTSMIGSLLTTPPSFDNKNGLSAGDAASGTESWKLSSGNMRSFSPGNSDNPYAFLDAVNDTEKANLLLTTAQIKYRTVTSNGFSAFIKGSFQKLNNNKTNIIPEIFSAYDQDHFTNYKISSNLGSFQVSPSYLLHIDNTELIFYTDYMMDYQKKDLDYFRNQHILVEKHALSRTSNELKYGVNFKWDFNYKTGLYFQLSNRNYYSNTIANYTNFFPYAGIKVDLTTWMRNILHEFDFFSVFFNAGRSMHEAPLVYNDPSILSTQLVSGNFNHYSNLRPIIAGGKLKPEIKNEYQGGISTGMLYNKIVVDIDYFNITTENFIAPWYNSGKQFRLDNVAKINNEGWNFSTTYQNNWGYDNTLKLNLNWATYTNKVKQTLNNTYIPIAGFSDISTGMLAGNPLGAIYGSSWLRNEQGQQIIGPDGFPLVNNTISMIGNPTPDWTAGFTPTLFWKRFIIDFTISVKKGGDVWNGTAAALDYLGMSQTTANERNIKGYVFNGVNSSGQPNDIVVDFYDPNQPLENNRWVRYGMNGVGEEYICDASWVRLSTVGIQYKFNLDSYFFRELSIGITGYNLLVFTGYKGVDPSSSLYTNASGSGLDLFNLPGTRSYVFNLKMNIGK